MKTITTIRRISVAVLTFVVLFCVTAVDATSRSNPSISFSRSALRFGEAGQVCFANPANNRLTLLACTFDTASEGWKPNPAIGYNLSS